MTARQFAAVPAALPTAPSDRGAARRPVEVRRYRFPRHLVLLFIALAVYVAAPVARMPLLGLSWSAPLVYVIALVLVVRLRGRGIRRQRVWIAVAVAIGLGIVASFAANAVGGSGDVLALKSVRRVVEWEYWMLCFIISVYIIREAALGPRLPYYFGAGIVALGITVLLERLVLGTMRPSGWSDLTQLTQNGYGWQFSTFSPFLLVPATTRRGIVRWLALLGLMLVWSAALLNASRSSWLGIGAGLITFALLHAIATRSPKGILVLALAPVVGLVILSVAPANLRERVLTRASTFSKLDTDKNYQIRLLMVQKAQHLFLEHPIFGAGPAQFTDYDVDLQLPQALRYAGEEHFNRKTGHNSYMLLLAEGGLACGIPFVILVSVLLLRGARAAVTLCRHGEPWALAAYASFIGMSVHCWAISALTATGPWVVYAALAAAVQRGQEVHAARRWGRRRP
jgi:O-antigen ligase